MCSSSSNPFPAGCQLAANGNATTTSGGVLRLTRKRGKPDCFGLGIDAADRFERIYDDIYVSIYKSSPTPGDGIAFVIQNAQLTNTGSNPLAAIGYTLGQRGMAERSGTEMTTTTATRIAASRIAWQSNLILTKMAGIPSANHVAVQSCGTGYNTSHHGNSCALGEALRRWESTIRCRLRLADGKSHTVTIQYNPPNTTPCDPTTPTRSYAFIWTELPHPTPVVAVPVDLSTDWTGQRNSVCGIHGFDRRILGDAGRAELVVHTDGDGATGYDGRDAAGVQQHARPDDYAHTGLFECRNGDDAADESADPEHQRGGIGQPRIGHRM